MSEEYRCPVCYAISKTHMCNPQNYHRNKLESDFKELQAQNSKLTKQVEKLDKALSEANVNRMDMIELVEKLKADNKRIRERLAMKEKLINIHSEGRVEELKTENEAMKQQLASVEEERDALKEALMEAHRIAMETPELNMYNYELEEDVRKLNDGMCELYCFIEQALQSEQGGSDE